MKRHRNDKGAIVVMLFFVCMCVTVIIPPAVYAQTSWISTGGPLGGLGYDVRIDPNNANNMFVTDNWAGIVKSVNAGQSWVQSNSGITVKGGTSGDAINIFSLTMDPNNSNIVWAGTQGGGSAFGVFKSTDSGATWTLKTGGIALGSDIGLVFRGFTIQKGNSNIVYAQAEVPTTVQGWQFNRVKGRVYKTTDGGDNWQLIWSGDNLARYLIIDPTNSNTLYLSTGIFDREAYNSDCANGKFGGLGVLKSTDGGATWNAVNSGLADLYVGSLRMHPSNPKVLFAATGNIACTNSNLFNITQGLFMSKDGGASWTKVIYVIPGEMMCTVNFSTSNPDVVYAGSSFAFYQSTDGGATWSIFQQPGGFGYGPPGIHAGFPIDAVVDNSNPNFLYANNYGGGVFRSQDGSATWEVWSNGYSGADIHKVVISPTNASGVYVAGRSGPFISTDLGNDWVGITNGSAANGNYEWYTIAPHPSNPNIILISEQHEGRIFLSTDGGNNFMQVAQHPDANAASLATQQGFRTIVFAPSNPSVVYAGLAKELLASQSNPATPTGTVIYKSTTGGASFTPMPSTLDGKNVNELNVDPNNANIIYAGTSSGLYKSTDGASTWTQLGSKNVETFTLNPQQAGYIAVGEVSTGVWVSQDSGATWSGPNNTGFNSPNPYITSVAVDPATPGVVFAGDLYSGVYQSTDKGFTWSPYPDSTMSGLTVRAVEDIAVNGQELYAATQGGGVFRYDRTSSGGTTQYTLTITESGSGTVTSSPSGISCPATCSVSFNSGSAVTLTAAAASGYTFTGWSGGGCSGTGTCSFTLNANTPVTATFAQNLTVANAGALYTTIQNAYSKCGNGYTIQVQTGTYPETDNFSNNISVVLKGGYDSSFSTSSSYSTISGTLTISNGTVTVQNITIQ